MLTSADPLSLSTKIGRPVIISSPEDPGLSRLDWPRWVSNMFVHFSQFSAPAPRKVFLIENEMSKSNERRSAPIEHVRQEMQSVDMMNLLGSITESTLLLIHGQWNYSLSSWIESLNAVAHATYSPEINTFYESQIDLWKKLEPEFSNDELYLINDTGNRFANASEICRNWFKRVLRSRVVIEARQRGWTSCVMSISPNSMESHATQRIHRLVTLDTSNWCGEPNWQNQIPTGVVGELTECDEWWISFPTAVLALDANARINQLTQTRHRKIYSPSVIMGWHPLRDFCLFLGSKARKRGFIFLDSSERLQIIVADQVEVSA